MGLSDKQKFLGALEGEEKNTFTKIYDKAFRSEKFGGAMFADFLSMDEISTLNLRCSFLPAEPILWGGFDGAERKMVGFNAEAEDFPLSCVRITTKTSGLTHRDYLGAIMGLGIERCKIGDIIVTPLGADIIADPTVGEYIASTLLTVGKAGVSVQLLEAKDVSFKQAEFSQISATVASLRLDSVTSVLVGKSRSVACELIKAGRVYVNATQCLKADVKINDEDVITVRGFGKAIVQIGGRSRKDRIFVTMNKYV